MGKHKNAAQDEIFYKYFQNHPDMANGLVEGNKIVQEQYWIQLKNELNAAGPPTKDVSSWKKTWVDWKRGIKRKLANNNDNHCNVTRIEDGLAFICGFYKTVDHIENDRSFGTSDANKEHSDSKGFSSSICFSPPVSTCKGKHKSPAQDKIFLNFFQVHPDLARGFEKGNKKAQDEYWSQLTNDLNAAGPPTKDVTSWKKTWLDWKGNIRRKLAQSESKVGQTDKDNDIQSSLPSIEGQLAVICDLYETVFGIENDTSFGAFEAIKKNNDIEISSSSTCSSPSPKSICKGKHRNATQDKIFLDFFREHPDLSRGFVKGKKKVQDKYWIQLSHDLNAAGPPTKDVTSWKKTWLDWKGNIRRKLIHNKCEVQQTGEGNGNEYILPPTEDELAVISGLFKTVNGIENPRSFGTSESNKEDSDTESSSSSNCSSPSPESTCKGKHRNAAQDKIFLNFFRLHPDLSRGFVKGNKKARDEYWTDLKNDLNAAGPPTKDVKSWKKAWLDWKGNIRRKLAQSKSEVRQIDGWNDNQNVLSGIEDELAVICDLYGTVGGLESNRNFSTFKSVTDNSLTEDSISSLSFSPGSPKPSSKGTLSFSFNSTKESCLLCLDVIKESVGCIKANSSQWHEFHIEKLIEKHLWPMQTIQLSSSWICKSCWEEINNFHKFYKRIEDAQMHFDSMTQIENRKECSFVNEMRETILVSPKSNIEEEKVNIKDEPIIDLWEDGENMNLLQINNSLQETLALEKNINIDPLQTSRKRKHSKDRTNFKTKKNERNEAAKTCKEKPTEKQSVQQFKREIGLLEINGEFNKNRNSYAHSNNKAYTKSHTTADTKNDKFIKKNFNLTCILCQIPMETFQALLIHFRTVHDEPGYVVCCNKKFFRRYILLDHLHQHLDPNYLRCKICNKVFGYRRILKIHGKIHDPKLRNRYCCDICGLSFHTSVVLNNHKTRHLTEEEKLYPCSECGKNFGSKWTLDNHNRKVHTSKINCDICGLLLANNAVLKRHKILRHSVNDRNEYKCPICSKLLTNQYGLNNHIRYAHKMGYNHKCTMCDRAFKRKRTLTEHMATHSDTRLYSCPWCPKTSNSHSNIATHRKKCHPKEEENRKQNSVKSSSNTLTSMYSFNQ